MTYFEDFLEPKESSIPGAGMGLFAKKKFKKGELIGIMYGKPASKNDTYVLWIEDIGIEIENNLKYINHSKKFNCELFGVMVYATKDISAGEELFWDYNPEVKDLF